MKLYDLYCRAYQGLFRLGSHLLPWREPEIFSGPQKLNLLTQTMKALEIQRVLIVTDAAIVRLGLLKEMLEALEEADIQTTIYDKTVPNPTIQQVEEAATLFLQKDCQGLIGFGGGSSMDCAKGIGVRIARPGIPFERLKGELKVRRPIPPLFAVPTTSGTGSEATVAAVLTDQETHQKYAINDPALIPRYALLDPSLTLGLPPAITVTTGMDALTHAVEAYIGRSNTKKTKAAAREAVSLVLSNLLKAWSTGSDLQAREAMMKASYLAGTAFTRAYVGYCHAMAHALGGKYSTPHGLANAIVLPLVLEAYGPSAHKKLAELADLAGLSTDKDSGAEKARMFIAKIRAMNQSMGIPAHIEGLKKEDIPWLVSHALREANPLYPVPRIMDKAELTGLFERLLP